MVQQVFFKILYANYLSLVSNVSKLEWKTDNIDAQVNVRKNTHEIIITSY